METSLSKDPSESTSQPVHQSRNTVCCGLKIGFRSFSMLLPVAELALWMVLVLMPATMTVYRFDRGAHGADYVRLRLGQFEQVVWRHRWFSFALERVSWGKWQTITAINLPGTVIEILISLPLSLPSLWLPQGLSLYTWRTLSYPFFCLPAWWLVRRGLDGLVRRIRLHWLTLFIGSISCLLCLVVLISFSWGLSPEERSELSWTLWGLGFWSVAFAVLPLAWLRQKTAKKPARMQ